MQDVVMCPKCEKSYPLIFRNHESFEKPKLAYIICCKCKTKFFFGVDDEFMIDWMEDISCIDAEFGFCSQEEIEKLSKMKEKQKNVEAKFTLLDTRDETCECRAEGIRCYLGEGEWIDCDDCSDCGCWNCTDG